MRIGLTGGIGSGKSTVAAMLAEHGMVVLDADRVAREVVQPGQPALDEVVAAFGPEVRAPDGGLDRAALADIVFDDAAARARLEGIVHPAVRAELARRSEAALARDPDAIVVMDIPLLIETGQAQDFDGVVVVVAPEQVRIDRLVAARGMQARDVRARMAAQVDDDTRRRVGTWVLDNAGSLDDLRAQVEVLVARLHDLHGRDG